MSKGGSAEPTPALQQLILAAALGALVLAFVTQDWLWRWDLLFYDAVVSRQSAPAPDDLIIVAIDDASLSSIGRWPWPRRVHAQLLQRLHAEGVKAVGFDVLLPEPDAGDPSGDALLAQAIRDSARTVLPVQMEQLGSRGQPLEVLPAPVFAQAARMLAHVHVELDRDGLARSVYLRAGLGDPYWPAFAEAVLRVAEPLREEDLPGAQSPRHLAGTAMTWVRDHRVLVPFRGRPGRIARISYTRVLEGKYPQGAFANSVVMIGATATGLSDNLPTPVSGYAAHMPGVEFHANLFAALRDGTTISVLPMSWRALLSVLLALAPLLLYPRLAPRAGLLAAVALIGVLFATSSGLLLFARVWFGPAPILVALLLSYPLWSWMRLEFAMRFLGQELERLRSEQLNVSSGERSALGERLRFVHAVLPVAGYVLIDPQGMQCERVGEAPVAAAQPPTADGWGTLGGDLWTGVAQVDGLWQVGLRWARPPAPTRSEFHLLDAAIRLERRARKREPLGRIEVVQARVSQMQHANARLRTLRGVIDSTLEQMEHGMLLIDLLGKVQLANQQAALFLRGDAGAELRGDGILDVLAALEVESGLAWPRTVARLMVERESVRIACRHADGRDLLGHAAPMFDGDGEVTGAIFNFADISALRQSERRRAEMLRFVSHDLRSPLVSIMALSELVADPGGEADRDDALLKVGEYAKRTLDLAEQFLELARAEGDEELADDEVDLMMVAMDALDSVWPQAEAKSIELEPRIDVDEARVRGDAGLLERVFVNLLTNAVKYSPQGARVGIELSRDESEICCCVFDSGYGIAPRDLERLFDSYQRVRREEHADESGVGLGLAFVKAAVERHGGRIEVDSEVNKGSRFRVMLPAVKA